MTAALDALLAELLAGEDPDSPEYPDCRARLEGLIADRDTEVHDQVLAEAADRVDQIASEMRACNGGYPEEWSSRDVRDAVETAAQALRDMRQAAARTGQEG